MVYLSEALDLGLSTRNWNLPCWRRCVHCHVLSRITPVRKTVRNVGRKRVGNPVRIFAWNHAREIGRNLIGRNFIVKFISRIVVGVLKIAWMDPCCRDILLERILAVGPKIWMRSTLCCTALPLFENVSLDSLFWPHQSLKQDSRECLRPDFLALGASMVKAKRSSLT